MNWRIVILDHAHHQVNLLPAAALDFLKNHSQGAIIQEDFDAVCGVGAVITPEQIEDAVRNNCREIVRMSGFC